MLHKVPFMQDEWILHKEPWYFVQLCVLNNVRDPKGRGQERP